MLKLLLSVILAALLGAAAGFSYTVTIPYLTEIYTLPLLYVAGGVVAIYIVSLLIYTKNLVSSFINIFLAGFIIIAIGYTALAYLIPVSETFPTLYKLDEANLVNSQVMLNLLTYIIIAIGPILANIPVGLVAPAPAKGKKGPQKGKQPAKAPAKGGKAEVAAPPQVTKETKEAPGVLAKLFPTLFAKKEKGGKPEKPSKGVPAAKEKKEPESPLAKLFPTLFAKKEKKGGKHVAIEEEDLQAGFEATASQPASAQSKVPELTRSYEAVNISQKLSEIPGPALGQQQPQGYQPPVQQQYQQPQMYQPPAQQYQPPQEMYQPPAQQYQPPQEMYQPPAQQYQPPQEMYQPPVPQYQPPAPQPDYSRMSFPSSTSTVKMTAQDVHAMFDELPSAPASAAAPASNVGPLKEAEFDSSFEGLFAAEAAPQPQSTGYQPPAPYNNNTVPDMFNQGRFQEQPAPYSIPPQGGYQPPVQEQFSMPQAQDPYKEYNIQPNVTTPYQQPGFIDPQQFLPAQYQDTPGGGYQTQVSEPQPVPGGYQPFTQPPLPEPQFAQPAPGGYQPFAQPSVPEPQPARPAPGGYQSPFAQSPVPEPQPARPAPGGYQSPFAQPPLPEQPPFVQAVENIAPPVQQYSAPPIPAQPPFAQAVENIAPPASEPVAPQQNTAGNEKISAKVVGDASSGRMNPGKMLLDSDAINKIAAKDETRDVIHRAGLTSTRVISAAKGHTLDALLVDINNIPGVHGSIIVGRDGLLIDSTIKDGTPKELIGAVGSSIYSNVEVATNRMQRGKLKQMFLNTDIGLTIINELEGLGLLIVLTDPEAQNNLVELLGAIRTTIEVSKMVGRR